ncbi:unnamed protein product [Bursaphelenchus okinawaensis]|uniref:Hsp90 chaperone protein kinase-targeting subunit n=1 Tax=Bursaphelenchus okinawaensis TaxID=465554 RepID=A0A811KAY6_9BILA|nr:unnamed protein product [Bursaphelenchus okinawaensis]CAG9096334.1 unnamed protein product [Bursaphelenchus okinawaensis]
MPIDYSKWKNIEVSDDEDDTHPNIDTPSLFRWRHQARLERMAEMKQKKEEVEGEKKKVVNKVQELEDKLKTVTDEKEKIKIELQISEIKKQEEEFRKKEKELEDQESKQPWNVDTIGHEAWSKSVVNKYNDKKPEPAKLSDEEENKRMTEYFKKNEDLLKKYCVLSSFDECRKFLLEYPHLASDFASSWITIEALNLAIDENYDLMSSYAKNGITIQYLLELAKSLNSLGTDPKVIQVFFKKIKAADAAYMKMYDDEVEAFQQRLIKRGREKREAAIAEIEAEEREERLKNAPGGLDPKEVFEALPKEMQEAFESQSVDALIHVAEGMDQEVFKYHLDRCIKSGLWIPNANDQDDAASSKGEAENDKPGASKSSEA